MTFFRNTRNSAFVVDGGVTGKKVVRGCKCNETIGIVKSTKMAFTAKSVRHV